MNIRLIQRGNFKKEFEKKESARIDDILSFQYMGSAEYEFGALGIGFKIFQSFPNSQQRYTEIEINGKKFNLLISQDFTGEKEKEIVDYLRKISNKKNQHEHNCKQNPGFYTYFEGEYIERLKQGCKKKTETIWNSFYTNFWIDIKNGWILFPVEVNEIKTLPFFYEALNKSFPGVVVVVKKNIVYYLKKWFNKVK